MSLEAVAFRAEFIKSLGAKAEDLKRWLNESETTDDPSDKECFQKGKNAGLIIFNVLGPKGATQVVKGTVKGVSTAKKFFTFAEKGAVRVGLKYDILNGKGVLKETIASGGSGSLLSQINSTIVRLTEKAKFDLVNTGKYADVLGHHTLCKSAFKNNYATDALFKQYYDEAFSVSVKQLEKYGGKGIHAKITGQQNKLYSAWVKANPNAKLTIDELANIEIESMTNVGIAPDIATGWVVKALEKLKIQGVSNITNVSWNGLN